MGAPSLLRSATVHDVFRTGAAKMRRPASPFPPGSPPRAFRLHIPRAGDPGEVGETKAYWTAPTPHRVTSVPSWADVTTIGGGEQIFAALQILGSEVIEPSCPEVVSRTRQEWAETLFVLFDSDGSGSMELDEFLPLMHMLDPSIPRHHVELSFEAAAGEEGATCLDLSQFYAWAEATFAGHTDEEAEEQFKEILAAAGKLETDPHRRRAFLDAAGMEDDSEVHADPHVVYFKFYGINRESFEFCLPYAISIADFREALRAELIKRGISIKCSLMRMFFEERELLDVEKVEAGLDVRRTFIYAIQANPQGLRIERGAGPKARSHTGRQRQYIRDLGVSDEGAVGVLPRVFGSSH